MQWHSLQKTMWLAPLSRQPSASQQLLNLWLILQNKTEQRYQVLVPALCRSKLLNQSLHTVQKSFLSKMLWGAKCRMHARNLWFFSYMQVYNIFCNLTNKNHTNFTHWFQLPHPLLTMDLNNLIVDYTTEHANKKWLNYSDAVLLSGYTQLGPTL